MKRSTRDFPSKKKPSEKEEENEPQKAKKSDEMVFLLESPPSGVPNCSKTREVPFHSNLHAKVPRPVFPNSLCWAGSTRCLSHQIVDAFVLQVNMVFIPYR